jgi:hypothetical protein
VKFVNRFQNVAVRSGGRIQFAVGHYDLVGRVVGLWKVVGGVEFAFLHSKTLVKVGGAFSPKDGP